METRAGSESPAIVLVRPREEGNVGAAARAMANMGLERLILVEPAAVLGSTARAMAVGARPLLDRAVRVATLREALAPFARVIATTSTRDRSLGIPLLAPRELPPFLAADPPGTPTALVFGPEVGGLTNDDLAYAGAVVTIPCAPAMPTLNLAQAVLVLAYELFVARATAAPLVQAGAMPATTQAEPAAERAATAGDIDGLMEHTAAVMQQVGFARDDTFAGALRDLRRLLARAAPDKRDVRILRGLCRRVQGALAKRGE